MTVISASELDRYGAEPLYRQLANAVKARITSGEWTPGDRLPTEQSLNRELNLSLSTVRNAYACLVKEGLVVRRAGQGSFVAMPGFSRSLGGLYNFTEEMRQLGKKPETRVLSFIRMTIGPGGTLPECMRHKTTNIAFENEPGHKATPHIPGSAAAGGSHAVAALRLKEGDEVFGMSRLRCADGEPLLLECSVVPVTLAPDLTEQDVAGSLYEALGRKAGIIPAEAHETHEAVTLIRSVADELSRRPGSAAFKITRVTFGQDGRPFEYSLVWAPGDSTRYEMDLKPESVAVTKAHGR